MPRGLRHGGGTPHPETVLVLGKTGSQLGALLVDGAYWEVYEGAAPTLCHKVAIKVISKRKVLEEDLRKLLPHQVLKGLCHKHLIRLYQGMDTRTGFHLLMELAPSGSILEQVQGQGPCSQGQAGLWFSQLLFTLAYLHSRAIVHRDLKLENLLLDSEENVKVSISSFSRTAQPYDHCLADTWSAGVILYALLRGCMPFDASHLRRLLHQTQQPPVFPRRQPLPPDCKEVILRLLCPAPQSL
ncbi:PREDICTED: testis-specific serine/threonine-protein kinase 4-like [Pygoscelis adeliae]|uniref:testis-specific serine/threonine-protein kinase 4-like n=1 Tax=Pygoscelis adeliae TaxID=9238 RepID=UPI0004F4E748|nr:PREDICTED: testis-specific serine/threonine-protein kinase 4-like [Pygoscelis adeliae]